MNLIGTKHNTSDYNNQRAVDRTAQATTDTSQNQNIRTVRGLASQQANTKQFGVVKTDSLAKSGSTNVPTSDLLKKVRDTLSANVTANTNAIKAVNVTLDMFNTDGATPTVLMQRAIDYLTPLGGGVIRCAQNSTLTWSGTTPKLPPGLAGKLLIDFNGSTIKFTASCFRLFDLNKTADNQNFNNFEVCNLLVDVGGFGTSQGSHVLMGSRINTVYIGRFNADNWYWHDIKVINVPSYLTTGYYTVTFGLAPFHQTANEATQNTITNITLERINTDGGTGGFTIQGYCAGSTTSANVYLDNINILSCRHTMPVPTSGYPSSNIQIGGSGYGGRCTIRDFYGTNAGDNGIEVNALQNVTITNPILSGAANYLIFFNNYRQPIDIKSQVFEVSGFKGQLSYPACRAWGFGLENSTNIRLGHVYLNNTIISTTAGAPFGFLSGQALNFASFGGGTKEIESVTVNNFTYSSNVDISSSNNMYGSVITLSLVNQSRIFLSNITVNLAGNISATGAVYPRLIETSGGSYTLKVSGLTVRNSINFSALWGYYASGAVTGGITDFDRYTVSSTTGSYTGFRLQGTIFSTGNELKIYNSDFTGISSGTELYYSDAGQPAFIQYFKAKLKTTGQEKTQFFNSVDATGVTLTGGAYSAPTLNSPTSTGGTFTNATQNNPTITVNAGTNSTFNGNTYLSQLRPASSGSYVSLLSFAGTALGRYYDTGNLVLNGTSDAGQKLQVGGNVLFGDLGMPANTYTLNASSSFGGGLSPYANFNHYGVNNSVADDHWVVIRRADFNANAVMRRSGLLFKLSDESSIAESNKMTGVYAVSTGGYSNGPYMGLAVGGTEVVQIKSGGILTTTNVQANKFTGSGTTPTISAGAGAGTSPTVSVVRGTQSFHQISITTGTSPTAASTIATITVPTAYANANFAVVPSAYNTAASGVTASVQWQGSTTTTYILTGTLAASTTYVWTVMTGEM